MPFPRRFPVQWPELEPHQIPAAQPERPANEQACRDSAQLPVQQAELTSRFLQADDFRMVADPQDSPCARDEAWNECNRIRLWLLSVQPEGNRRQIETQRHQQAGSCSDWQRLRCSSGWYRNNQTVQTEVQCADRAKNQGLHPLPPPPTYRQPWDLCQSVAG